MSPRPNPEMQIADHERRLNDLEETMKGKDRTPGVLERVRDLEDDSLVGTAKRAAVMAVVTLIVTAAPLLGIVLPAVQRLQEAIDRKPTVVGAVGRIP